MRYAALRFFSQLVFARYKRQSSPSDTASGAVASVSVAAAAAAATMASAEAECEKPTEPSSNADPANAATRVGAEASVASAAADEDSAPPSPPAAPPLLRSASSTIASFVIGGAAVADSAAKTAVAEAFSAAAAAGSSFSLREGVSATTVAGARGFTTNVGSADVTAVTCCCRGSASIGRLAAANGVELTFALGTATAAAAEEETEDVARRVA